MIIIIIDNVNNKYVNKNRNNYTYAPKSKLMLCHHNLRGKKMIPPQRDSPPLFDIHSSTVELGREPLLKLLSLVSTGLSGQIKVQ